jgi:AAA+ ATPase superfamily predicted ATPase/Holliday junction resolvase
MLFETSNPVTGPHFVNREPELRELLASVPALRQGRRSWYVLLGPRKIGKSSLLLEMAARVGREAIIVLTDCWPSARNPFYFLSSFVANLVDATLIHTGLAEQTGLVSRLRDDREQLAYFAAKVEGLGSEALSRGVERLRQLARREISPAALEEIFDLPEQVANERGEKLVVIFDEFQEIKQLERFDAIKKTVGELLPLLRSVWQRQQAVNYLLSGSKITLLREMIEGYDRAFFQHFHVLNLGGFTADDAACLLREGMASRSLEIPSELIDRLLSLFGPHPFYLQVMGEELSARAPLDEQALKETVQEVLFNDTGRLSIYFQNLQRQIVENSSSLESALLALAEPRTTTELAAALNVSAGSAGVLIRRLKQQDVLARREGNRYGVADPAFALWLQSRSPLKALIAPLTVGTAFEIAVAKALAAAGFQLVYQSKASRGTFDLLAIFNSHYLGVQCRKGNLPVYLPAEDYQKMETWAAKLGWTPILAVGTEDDIRFYHLRDVQRTRGKGYRLDDTCPAIENVLSLVTSAGLP